MVTVTCGSCGCSCKGVAELVVQEVLEVLVVTVVVLVVRKPRPESEPKEKESGFGLFSVSSVFVVRRLHEGFFAVSKLRALWNVSKTGCVLNAGSLYRGLVDDGALLGALSGDEKSAALRSVVTARFLGWTRLLLARWLGCAPGPRRHWLRWSS